MTARKAPQKTSPASETEGYKAAGGELRPSIRDRIAAIAPYTSKLVKVEEWGLEIEVRSMNLGQRNNMLGKAALDDGGADMNTLYPEIVIACCYDPETGEKVFLDDDEDFLKSYPAGTIDKLAVPAMELSGMGDKAVDEEAKKSSETDTFVSDSLSQNEPVEPSTN